MHSLTYPVLALLALPNFQTVLTYLAAGVCGLGVLVFVHELGHYAVAKWCGVRVEVFSLGFGKRIWGFRRGETDYRVSILPLGGYVKMAGENPMEERTGDPGEFMSHPRWQRFLIAIAGPVMNIIFAVALLTVVYMYHHEYPAYGHLPVDVFMTAQGSPAEKAGLQKGDRIIKIQGVENPDWNAFLNQEGISPNQPLDITVERNGQVRKLTIVAESKGVDHIGDIGLLPPFAVGKLEPGKPAEQAGIQPGDILVSADGTPMKNIDDMLAYLQKVKGKPVQIGVFRDGKEFSVTVSPQLLDTPNQGRVYRVGISGGRVERLPFSSALVEAGASCRENSKLIFTLVGRMFHSKEVLQQFSGPIGIIRISGEAVRASFWIYFEFVAMISLNLAIFNLLPIPILDGGLMLMLLIESIMRRDIRQEIKERVYQAAFVFLLLFAAVVIFNDVVKTLHM